jgi:hypothetical protein
MAITIRLGREEEQRLRERATPHNSELEEGLRALTEAMRAAFPGLDSVVRMESEDGRLMAEAALETIEPASPSTVEDDLRSILATPRTVGSAFGCLAGKGSLRPELEGLPFRAQVAAAAARAAAARDSRGSLDPATASEP